MVIDLKVILKCFLIVSLTQGAPVFSQANNHIELGNEAFFYRDIDRSIQLYQMALRDDPASIDGKIGLARAYLAKNHLDRVINLANQVLDEDPSNDDALLLKGKALTLSAQWNRARKSLLEYINSNENSIEANDMLLKVLVNINDIEGAKALDNKLNKLRSTVKRNMDVK